MKKIVMLVIAFFLINSNSFAQCSDGGVCSIGGHAMEQPDAKFELSLGYSFGYSGKEDDISYSTINLSGQYTFLEETSFNFIVPFNFISGPLDEVHGIGDLIFSLNHGFELSNSRLTISAGARLATGTENVNYKFLPQPYKSSLGSNDILLGINYSFSNFSLGVGYQVAGKPVEDNFTSVERGDDLLLRAGYTFNVDDFTFNPQLLFIKRLSESKMYFLNSDPAAISIPLYTEVPGSDQSQLNLLVNATYNVNEYYSHFIEVALPFLERDVNVDGLKRTFTISTGLSFSF